MGKLVREYSDYATQLNPARITRLGDVADSSPKLIWDRLGGIVRAALTSGCSLDKIGDELPGLASALAGLILVFLGVVFAAWDSYDTGSKNAVRKKYRVRAWVTFASFLLSIISGALGLVGIGTDHSHIWVDCVGLLMLILSTGAMVFVAYVMVREI